ncbi:hypothetical protein [Haloarchaeobius sp. DFWS5]|uniref:hypothetical protein n=1 Tax=Haloarchaeobius sp. DFWS5 TaxID=3446114 RepID=UPI003EBDFEA5
MQRRRTLLATLGAAVATAGCFTGDDGPPTDTSRRETDSRDTQSETRDSGTTGTTPDQSPQPFSEPLDVGDSSIQLTGPVVQHSFFHRLTPDSLGVTGAPTDHQFLFIGVGIESEPRPGASEFTVTTDETTATAWRSFENQRVADLGVANGDYPYSADGEDGWLGFDLPAPLSGEPRLEISVNDGSAATSLPQGTVASLGSPPPSFTFDELSYPEEVESGEPIRVRTTVTNEGAGAGTFRAVVNQTGPTNAPHTNVTPLEPGQSAPWEVSFGAQGADRVTFRFRSADTASEHEVQVGSGGTTTV